jgi:hypothetical protein
MRYFPVLRSAVLGLAAALSVHCATATTLPLDRPVDRPATGQLADVRLEEGTECIVRLMTGDTVRGRLERIGSDRIDLRLPDAFRGRVLHSIRDADVALLARVVKRSNARRGWIGAAIGAAVVAPFGVSMTGDMMLAGAVLGALIGRGTGNSRAEVVFERQPSPQ